MAQTALPLLPTTVVGSYSVPDWLGRVKSDYYRGRISHSQYEEVHDAAIKAAIKDQEVAGIDIISDGELRRDNDVDYLIARVPGIHLDPDTKARNYFDYFDAEAREPIITTGAPVVGLAEDYEFTSGLTAHPIKFSFTGPLSLSRRVRDNVYGNERDFVLALADLLNNEARRLVEAGARFLQIDEPFLAGYPQLVDLAMEAVGRVVHGVDAVWMLHVCWGNRYARPLWQGHYDFLFPAVLAAPIDQLVLEFARTGYDDLKLFAKYAPPFQLGVGVIDVKSDEVESAATVARRIRRALDVLPADRLMINPDCGLRHVAHRVTAAKLRAMVAGTQIVRAELG